VGFLVGFILSYYLNRCKLKKNNLITEEGCLFDLSKKKDYRLSKEDEKLVDKVNIARALMSLPFAFLFMLKEASL